MAPPSRYERAPSPADGVGMLSLTMPAATPAQIAAMRRRYLVMATAVFWLDLAIVLIFNLTADALDNVWRSLISSIAMLAVMFVAARWLFEPVRLFLEGKA